MELLLRLCINNKDENACPEELKPSDDVLASWILKDYIGGCHDRERRVIQSMIRMVGMCATE